MAKSKEPCRFCLNITYAKNFTIIEGFSRDMLNLILPAKRSDEFNNGIMCGICSAKLFAAFEFKSTCLYTDNTIKTYVECEGNSPLDIRQIYMKEIENKQLVSTPGDQEVCRLCLEPITDEFTSTLELDHDLIQIYIPEINLDITKDPVICKACSDSFHGHASFVKTLQGSENDHLNSEDKNYFLNSCDLPVKLEDAEMMTDAFVKTDKFQVKSDDPELDRLTSTQDLEKDTFYDGSKEVLETLGKLRKTRPRSVKTEAVRNKKKKMYKCDKCAYETVRRDMVKRHSITHMDCSEVKMYKCDKCSYRSKHKYSFKNHQLQHTDPSQLKMYKCDKCDYETKRRGDLPHHYLRHEDPSLVKMYKCNECDYQTKYKGTLGQHLLGHRAASEVQMYKCDKCNYETRHSGNLPSHQLKHRNAGEVLLYKCDVCEYETKYKCNFNKHKLRHGSVTKKV